MDQPVKVDWLVWVEEPYLTRRVGRSLSVIVHGHDDADARGGTQRPRNAGAAPEASRARRMSSTETWAASR